MTLFLQRKPQSLFEAFCLPIRLIRSAMPVESALPSRPAAVPGKAVRHFLLKTLYSSSASP